MQVLSRRNEIRALASRLMKECEQTLSGSGHIGMTQMRCCSKCVANDCSIYVEAWLAPQADYHNTCTIGICNIGCIWQRLHLPGCGLCHIVGMSSCPTCTSHIACSYKFSTSTLNSFLHSQMQGGTCKPSLSVQFCATCLSAWLML